MLEIILGSIFEKIIDPVIQPVARHAGFLFHYKRNLKNLEDEVNNLQEQRSDVEGKVNEANRRGDAIDNKVSVWLEDADKTRQQVEEFRDEKTDKENMLCFSFSCPNFISRYRLSKEAERKVVRVKHLTEKGGNIGTVSHPREDPPEVVFRSSGNYECFHSRDKVFKDVVKALKDPEVNMIGVYGTGGVGKTTMVTKVAEQVKKDGIFDEVVIAVVSQDANVIKIQGQLAARLKLPLSGETDDEVGRASRLWNRLDNGMKNLIILDDVWHELDLKKIGIPISDGNKSCKVVLTARNRDVWKNMDVDKDFKIEILIEKESWALFQKKVGNYVDTDQELREIAWAVCKECQGLPVAINAIGAALKNKDMYAWRDALVKLQNNMLNDIEGIDRQVYASLKWSYDRLDSEDAKSCFLLCCLFPEDARIPIDDLVRYYMAGRTFHHDQKPDSLERALDLVRTVVSTLISCCLLLDENYSEDVVKMHDVVRDVAISIAKGEKSFLVKHGVKHWLEKATYEQCSVISLRPHDMREFPDELVCPALHTLRLDGTNNEYQLQVPDTFFSGTKNLMVLDLKSVTMSPVLPASLAKLAKLQMLCLDRCKLGDIAILKDLKDHLEILSLRRSDVEVLPPEVGELTHLRVLDMDDCDKLKVIPKGVISKLFLLEELYMPRWFSQWEGTRAGIGSEVSCVSLDELISLTRLTTLFHVHIRDPALLPKDFTFENLVRFYIAVGENASNYFYDKPSTGVLELENIHLANTLEGLLGKPKWCRQRNGLYPSKSFNHLTVLSIRDCSWKYLFSPSLARGLVRLKKLAIDGCMDMEGVIGNEGEGDEDIIPISFSRLNELSLLSLPNLKSFYPKKEKKATSSESCSAHNAQTVLFTDKVACPALQTLTIKSVPKITAIWYKQNFLISEKEIESSFNQLRRMAIRSCDKLMNVVGGRAKMEAIVTEKQKGKEVDGYVTCFPNLTELSLQYLPNLESFCSHSIKSEAQFLFNHQVSLPALEQLKIYSVPEITEIWDKQIFPIPEKETESSFCHLKYIRITGCSKLMNVVGGCPKIEATVTEKQKGKEVDYYFTRFPNLTILTLRNLPSLESFCSRSIQCEAQPLFDHQVAFPSLEKLSISSLPNITNIWDKKLRPAESFCQLKELDVFNCSKLVNLVQSTMLPQLQNLQRLRLDSCSMVGGVVDLEKREEETQEPANKTIVPFPELTSMVLGGLQNIKGFCTITSEEQPVNHAQVAFPKLEFLRLRTLGGIALRQLLGGWEPSIKTLVFSKCDEISTVVSPRLFRRLRNVDLLCVESCIGVREAFHFDGLEVGEGQECVGSLIHVRKIQLKTLPKLTCLWNKDPHGLLGLQNLEHLTIKDCPLLRNLLTASVAKALGRLKVLYLMSSSTMEEVIATEEGHVDVIDDEEIVFPKLEWLILKDLSNLKSFCSANYNFNLSSLKTVVVKRCPNMQTFTSGSIRMPSINFITRRNDGPVIEDLNKHLQQRHLKGEEIIAADEMAGNEDIISFFPQEPIVPYQPEYMLTDAREDTAGCIVM